jgi:hypothetical protein
MRAQVGGLSRSGDIASRCPCASRRHALVWWIENSALSPRSLLLVTTLETARRPRLPSAAVVRDVVHARA